MGIGGMPGRFSGTGGSAKVGIPIGGSAKGGTPGMGIGGMPGQVNPIGGSANIGMPMGGRAKGGTPGMGIGGNAHRDTSESLEHCSWNGRGYAGYRRCGGCSASKSSGARCWAHLYRTCQSCCYRL